MFFKAQKDPFIKALDMFEEPAFLFSRKGEYRGANAAGDDFLLRSGLDPKGYYGFVVSVKKDAPYTCREKFLNDMILLRLIPEQTGQGHLRRISHALEIMPWGVMTVERQGDTGTLVFANACAGAFLQIPVPNMTGKNIMDVFRVAGMGADISDFGFFLEAGHKDISVTIDGRPRWLRIHVLPARDGDLFIHIIMEDTTESKMLQSQHLQSQRLEALGQLAGGVAHDFNNLLSIIDGYARVAKKSAAGNAQIMNYMDHIGKAVERGASLTARLLTFGRHKVVKDTVLDLGKLIEDQEPLLRPLMDASVVFSINTQGDIPVEIASDSLCQVLMNLCVNARDAMPDGGTLMIDCMRVDNRARIQVIDSGCGMAPDVQARIFDPFFTTKDQGKGTGLGLSMAYSLIKDMKGDIEVESRPGQGSVFTIWLPLSNQTQALVDFMPVNPHETLEGLTVLVAEDEPDLLELVSGMIESMGAHVLRASNGNQAMQVQERYDGQIDFLLTDVVMPEMNGVKLSENVHDIRPDVKTLFMSGYPATGLLARIQLPEGALLMPKPVDFEKLSVVIRTMLSGENDNAAQDRAAAIVGQWKSSH